MARYTKEELINLEKNIINRYNDNELPFLFHLCGGNEDELIRIFDKIKEGDWVISTHRNHYHAYLHGIPPEEVESRVTNGRSMFMYDNKRKFFCSAIVGGIPGIAAGIALGLKRKNIRNKVWCFVGDGCEDTGHFAEAVRYVDGWDLPCTFIVEDNDISISATKKDRWGSAHTPTWPSCVERYHYKLPFPHARTEDFCDLKKTLEHLKTDEEYFPHKPKYTDSDSNASSEELCDASNSCESYGDAVKTAMTALGKEDTLFFGYNLGENFGNAMGTLSGVRSEQKIETPVAENLMGSLALGASLVGFKSVVYYERHDFMLVAADVIGNHISHLERISHKEFVPNVILRTVVSDGGPFYSGPTHSQDLTSVFKELVSFPVLEPKTRLEVIKHYHTAQKIKGPFMIVERKSCYTKTK